MAPEFDDDEFAEHEFSDDHEAPQPRDLDDADDDETPTEPCPNCRREVAEFAEQCPHCGDWITSATRSSSRRSASFVVIALIVLAAFVWWLLR
ncbi:MAG: hypothetical protein KKB50_04525 [Planctomycetes bacterium]|nr:hypothetical protein [Planctomycetota bacterium]